MPTITQVIEAAKVSGHCNHPTSVRFWLDGSGRWAMKVERDTTASASGADATGETPEACVSNLADRLRSELIRKADRAKTEADQAQMAVETLSKTLAPAGR